MQNRVLSRRANDRVRTRVCLMAFELEARFLIFDRVKREYLGSGVAVVRRCVLFQENGWRSEPTSHGRRRVVPAREEHLHARLVV
jgi:hypothetical protein